MNLKHISTHASSIICLGVFASLSPVFTFANTHNTSYENLSTLVGTLEIMYGDKYDPITHKVIDHSSYYILKTKDRSIPLDMHYLSFKNYHNSVGKRVQLNVIPSIYKVKSVLSLEKLKPSKNKNIFATLISKNNKKKPWFNIMCKFSDIADEPISSSEVAKIFDNAYPFLEDYWRVTTYGHIDIAGTETMNRWVTLPHPREYYVKQDNMGMESAALDELETDCKKAASYIENKDKYYGTNLFFNGNLDGAAWGGGTVTWFPLWSHKNLATIAHEMGHCYGLSHSSGDYGNTYDSPWDLMSNTSNEDIFDIYYSAPQHTIAYYKQRLGAIPDLYNFSSQKQDISDGYTLELSQQEESGKKGKYLIANIYSKNGKKHYTVEARNQIGYDVVIPAKTVLIHEIRLGVRAYIVDSDDNGNVEDEGVQWQVGETFRDEANNIEIEILEEYNTGFKIRVLANGDSSNPQLFTVDKQAVKEGDYIYTQVKRPKLSGICEKGTNIAIKQDNNVLPSNTVCSSNGRFSFVPVVDLKDGLSEISIIQTNQKTNQSTESTAVLLMIDAVEKVDYALTLNAEGTIINGKSGMVDLVIRVAELNGGVNHAPLQFTLVKNKNFKVYFTSTELKRQDNIVENNKWKMKDKGNLYQFTYIAEEGAFPASSFSRIGLSAQFTSPSNSKGGFSLDITLSNNIDENKKNNQDTEYLEYNNILSTESPTL